MTEFQCCFHPQTPCLLLAVDHAHTAGHRTDTVALYLYTLHLQVAGVLESPSVAPPQAKPLILLNDKRYGNTAKADRRMIMDIDRVAADLQELYPNAEVRAVRFRDLSWPDQLRLLSRASVFVTTQGSSAFRLVFLPKGATCIMVGSPDPKITEWKSFHELDR